MKTNFITKLFYRKYPFKIVISNRWISDTKYRTIDYFTNLKGNKNSYFQGNTLKEIIDNIESIKKLYKIIENTNVKKRYEYNSLSLFIDNEKFFNEICADLGPVINSISIPPSNKILQELLDKNRIEIKKNLTYDCRYKVILRNSGKDLRPEVKENFLNLVKRHKDRFVIPYNANYFFQKNVGYFYLSNSFFYVKDSKMLMMTQMILQPVIKEVISIFTYEEIENKDLENDEI